jgi:hypothetical protein
MLDSISVAGVPEFRYHRHMAKKGLTIHLTEEDRALFTEEMHRDGLRDVLGPWIISAVRRDLERRQSDRNSLKMIEQTVLDIQKRLQSKHESSD